MQDLLESVFSDPRGTEDSDPASETTSGVFVSLHQHGELVLWPWWDTPSATPNGAGLEAIGRKFASYNGYTAGPGATTLYQCQRNGRRLDVWHAGSAELHVRDGPGVHARLRDRRCNAVAGEFRAILYAAKIARTPYATVLGPDANLVTVGRNGSGFTITATIDDTANGGQEVAAAEYYVDTPPWQQRRGGQPLAAVDGSFDGLVERCAAALPSDGISPGRHVVYVRGQDAAGHWGPFSAGLLAINAWQNTSNPCDVDGVDDAKPWTHSSSSTRSTCKARGTCLHPLPVRPAHRRSWT